MPGNRRCFARFRITLQPLQVGLNVGRMLIPNIAILFQGFIINDPFQFRWKIRIQAHRRGWFPVQNGFN
jgi:hypothetical protein